MLIAMSRVTSSYSMGGMPRHRVKDLDNPVETLCGDRITEYWLVKEIPLVPSRMMCRLCEKAIESTQSMNQKGIFDGIDGAPEEGG